MTCYLARYIPAAAGKHRVPGTSRYLALTVYIPVEYLALTRTVPVMYLVLITYLPGTQKVGVWYNLVIYLICDYVSGTS